MEWASKTISIRLWSTHQMALYTHCPTNGCSKTICASSLTPERPKHARPCKMYEDLIMDPHRVLILNSSCCAYWSLQILLIMICFGFDNMTVRITMTYDDIDWRKDAKRLGWLLTSVFADTEAPNDDGLYSMVMSVDSRGGKTTRLFKTCIAPIDRKCSVSWLTRRGHESEIVK